MIKTCRRSCKQSPSNWFVEMDDKNLLIPVKDDHNEVIFTERNYIRNRFRRFYLLTTILTICLAAVIGLSGIYAAWFGEGCWFVTGTTAPNKNTSQTVLLDNTQCTPASQVNRFDCWPEGIGATQDKCQARGCCWRPISQGKQLGDAPWCFYPTDYQLYQVQSLTTTTTGMTAQLVSSSRSGWPNDIQQLKLDVVYETSTRLHFKISDPNNKRYEVPVNLTKVDKPVPATSTDYIVEVPSQGPFYITVKRKSTGKILFSSRSVAPLVFADQFIQFGTELSSQYIYGLGEHMDKFAIDVKWKKYVLWSRDQPPSLNTNLYGSHPFYLNIEEDHNAHGVFLLNSNAMEIELQESPALTYRTTGGILDFYIFTGPTPDSVVEQYSGLIGRSFMPPYWALGFHLCKYGYGSSAEVKQVIQRMRDAQMPYDTQWTDIDYMKSYLDWTYDAQGKFPDLPDIVRDLHDHGQHYIPIIDPGISNTQPAGSYPPFDEGIKQGVFIMKQDGSGPVVGKVWPGETAYPDFFHPNSTTYWTNQAKRFHDQVPFDGLWIDMNEPSNFYDGTKTGCPSSSLDNPPFTPPGIVGGKLNAKTVCMSSKQYISSHYNLHSLYGHSEAVVTKRALDKIYGNNRSLIISRSTFPTTGVHAGHWLGDNSARWDHTYYSITGMLKFQLFGISLVGADICGFLGDTTPELCTRWMQLGAFYPFMRNHNSLGNKDQDPAVFDKATQNIMRTALQIRYTLLPYLYTLFYKTHINGTAIVRPLFFQYHENNAVYSADVQFMWGTSLLITPVTSEHTTQGQGYLPKDRWYDYFDYTYVDSPGHFVTFLLPMEHTNIQVRGGSIIPMQEPAVTTTLARKNKFFLLVALSPNFTASGELYWDDGVSRDSITSGKYNFIRFHSAKRMLSSTIITSGYTDESMTLGSVRIMDVDIGATGVTVNGAVITSYIYQNKSLFVYNLDLNLLTEFTISWLI